MNTIFFKVILCSALAFISPYALAADSPQTLQIGSCEATKMKIELGDVKTISFKYAAKICNEIETSLGKLPSKTLFRNICKTVALMKVRDTKETHENIAYQIMNVIEVRQQNNEDAMLATVDTLWIIFDGSNGRVTPKDMNFALRKYQYSVKDLTRKDLFKLGAMIHESKKMYAL